MAGTAIKITKFLGEAPKISPELLPESVGQYAFNLDLSSGDLLPFRAPTTSATLDKPGVIKTIYPMDDGAGGLKWLHWTTDVDIARSQLENDTTQRIYYSGDGAPKVTNYSLATSGSQFPTQSYTLGLPLPTAVPSASVAAFSNKTSASRARDAGNTATIVTSAAHGLTTGNYVTISGMSGTGYNVTNAQVTVVNSTTFTYYSFGATETTTADTGATIALAGVLQARTYVFTYYTAWEEESVPSEPSPLQLCREGQIVTVSGLPTSWTHGAGYQTAGMKLRVYRTVVGVAGTEYFRVGEMPLGGATSGTYSRTGTTITATATAHKLSVGDRVSLTFTTGTATSGGYEVITAADANTFTVTDTVSGTTSGNVTINTGQFVDNVDVALILEDPLESLDYDQPEPTMQGLMAIHNNMMVGFFGSTVCFSEPGKPHAWPIIYRKQVDSPIVALGAFGTTLIVLTDKVPWTMTGNNPAAQTLSRTDYILPCVSKQSVVNLGFGVAWSSTGGLAIYSQGSMGVDYLTKNVHSWTTWPTAVTPTALFGEYYRGRYFGSDGENTFIFERNDQVGGHLIESDIHFTTAYYRTAEDEFYYVDGSTVHLWNSPTGAPAALDWKSKVFTTKEFVNFGAARVIADYFGTTEEELALEEANAAIRDANQLLMADPTQLHGSLGDGDLNELVETTSRLTPLLEADYNVTFQLFVNKKLIFTTVRSSDYNFRLPTGYRADTFEVRVATNARVRAIHLAETMAGLRSL